MNNSVKLYHGTDARLISMPETDRCAYIENCKLVVEHLWSVFKPYYETNETVETIINGNKAFVFQRKIETYKDFIIERSNESFWWNFQEKLSMCECNNKGSQLYQYGELFLTGDMEKAKRYAYNSFAGGEIASIAYRLIQGAEILGWDNWKTDETLNVSIQAIKTFAESKASPVVIPISELDMDYLFYEKGDSVNIKDKCIWPMLSFRYLKKYTISLEKAIYLE